MTSLRLAILLVALLAPTALIGQSSDDPVYTVDQVDVKAKVKNQLDNLPDANTDCHIPVAVSLRVVLRKSGKVTDITYLSSSLLVAGCVVTLACSSRHISTYKTDQQESLQWNSFQLLRQLTEP